MIYLLGASHMGVVLKSWVNNDDDNLIKEFGKYEPKFIEFKTNDGNSVSAASIYIGHYAKFWGAHLAKIKNDAELEINSGFLNLLNSLSSIEKNGKLYIFMTGQEHYHLGIQKFEPKYDFNIPWRSDLSVDSDTQIISFEIILRQVNNYLLDFYSNTLAIRRLLPKIDLYNVVCPPPAYPSNFSRDIYRLKYYIVYQNLLNEFSKSLNINVLCPPVETLNELGFLMKEYSEDEVHGNFNYAQKVISQIKGVF